MIEPIFLSLEEVLFIHNQEISIAGGEPNTRDKEAVKACVEAPKASFGGEYLYDLFEMATSYLSCFVFRHPFVDGNKRTALASALTFLYLNGYQINENHDLELAELVVDLVTKKITKEQVSLHLKEQSF